MRRAHHLCKTVKPCKATKKREKAAAQGCKRRRWVEKGGNLALQGEKKLCIVRLEADKKVDKRLQFGSICALSGSFRCILRRPKSGAMILRQIWGTGLYWVEKRGRGRPRYSRRGGCIFRSRGQRAFGCGMKRSIESLDSGDSLIQSIYLTVSRVGSGGRGAGCLMSRSSSGTVVRTRLMVAAAVPSP